MLLGIGSAEFVIAVPILIAAIMAHCTPTTIAMGAWVSFHAVIGMIAGAMWYFFRRDSPKSKQTFRMVYLATVSIGIALAIASAIHGGVGWRIGSHQVPSYVDEGNGTIATQYHEESYYNYSFDIFFGVFLGLFEIMVALIGIWFFFADKRKAKQAMSMAGTPRGSFANLQAALKAKAANREDKSKRGSVDTLESTATRSASDNASIESVSETPGNKPAQKMKKSEN